MEILHWMMNDAVESDDQTAPPNNWEPSPTPNQCYSIQRYAIVGQMKIVALATVTFVRRPMFDALEIRWVSYDLPPVGIHRTMWSVPKRCSVYTTLCVGVCVCVDSSRVRVRFRVHV